MSYPLSNDACFTHRQLCLQRLLHFHRHPALNIVTIIALRKPLTIPRALKIFLLSLAVSDLGVGLLVQPLYITRLVMMIKENTQTRTFEITLNSFYATGNFLSYASFFDVVALTADRYLAVHFYLRYQELVTQKRVVAVVISNWI